MLKASDAFWRLVIMHLVFFVSDQSFFGAFRHDYLTWRLQK